MWPPVRLLASAESCWYRSNPPFAGAMVDQGVLPRRRQLRLRDYDYSHPAAYFITICVHQRRHLFGVIRNGIFEPTQAGCLVNHWWAGTANKFAGTLLDESIVMPNHFHAIVGLTEQSRSEGVTLGRLVGWFKAMTTNAYLRGVRSAGFPPLRKRLWQRGYFEHIVRDEGSLDRIRAYIAENPLAWDTDPENPDDRSSRVREPWQR